MMQHFRQRFRGVDAHTHEVISGALIAFVLRGLGAALAFALNVAVARLLGVEGAGLYFLAMSVTAIMAVIAKLGLDNSLLRFIASAASQKDWGQVKGVFRLGIKWAGAASLFLSLLCLIFAPWIAQLLFNKPELVNPLRFMSLAIFSFTLMTLLAESLKGLKRIRESMLVSGVLYPVFSLLLVWPLIGLFGVTGASLSYVVGTGIAALFGLFYWKRASAQHDVIATDFSHQTLWSSCRPLWLMSIINRAVLPWAPLFLLGVWGTSADSGIFGAATRVSMLVTFFLLAVNTILAPKFSELYTKGDLDTLGRLSRRFAVLITLAASPFFLLFILAGDWVMGLFGPDFSRGGLALAILAIGQLVNTMTGPVGYVLMMSGNEKDLQTTSLLSIVLMGGLAVAMIPTMGIVGAAISSASSAVLISLLATYFVWYRLGLILMPFVRN